MNIPSTHEQFGIQIESLSPEHIPTAHAVGDLVTRSEWQNDIFARNDSPNPVEPDTFTMADLRQEGGIIPTVGALINTHAQGEAPQITGSLGHRLLEKASEMRERAYPQSLVGSLAVAAAGIALKTPAVSTFINSHTVDTQKTSWIESWPATADLLKDGVQNGIGQGYIPAVVAERLPDALQKTKVAVTDKSIVNARDNANAVYHGDTDTVTVAGGEERVAVHEFVHKLSGGTFVQREVPGHPEKTRIDRVRLANAEFSQRSKRTISEAVDEHITQGILTGDFQTVDPDARGEQYDDAPGYWEERKVLAAFIERSQGIVSTKLFTRSHFEDTGPDGGIADRRTLVEAAQQAYGPGALRKLEVLMQRAPHLSGENLNRHVFDLIKPPVLNADGSVRERGRINIR